MKKVWTILVILAMVGSCAACGSASGGSSSSAAASPGTTSSSAAASSSQATTAPSSSEPSSSEPSAGASSSTGESSYTLERPITVDGNQTLTLCLNGITLDNGLYGISSIDVRKGNQTIQTLLLHDAIMAEWGSDDFDGATQSPAQDGGLWVDDINFDGAGDIGLIGWVTAGANQPYYYWLWDAGRQQFTYAFSLCNVSVDTENHQLLSATQNGANEVDTDYYTYDSNGKLQNVKRVVEITQEDGSVDTQTYTVKDGELILEKER